MTSMMTDLFLSLGEPGAADAARAGRKAATLCELRRAGFPVPDGFVITVDAFEHALAGLDRDATAEQVRAAELPPGVADGLAAATTARLGAGPVAVRSSGVDEDLAGASYAGQYETVLGVTPDELPDAVRRCWASAFSDHVTAYRGARGASPGAAMAVLVQQMVTPDAAGVVFSADPVTGDRDAVVVSAVRGLGDRLVDGSASPDEWVVRGNEATCRTDPEGALDAEGARAVAELARRLEAWFGAPQDVEWALAGGRLFLLQSRPITALPEPPPAPMPVPVDIPGSGSGSWAMRRRRGRRWPSRWR
jgi:pyruvate,water dikinase